MKRKQRRLSAAHTSQMIFIFDFEYAKMGFLMMRLKYTD